MMKFSDLTDMFARFVAKHDEQVASTKQAAEQQYELLHNIYFSRVLETKEVWNGRETAYMLDVTEDHLYRLTSQKKIRFYKPEGKKNYFRKEDVIAFMLRNEQRTAEEISRAAVAYKGKGGRSW